MNSTKKGKYLQIPIVSHNSEKPSLIFEEICSGKFYPIKHNFNSETKAKKCCATNINKKYKEIPIIAHDSEKPCIVIEEISSGKQYSNIRTTPSNKISDKKEKKSQQCTKKEKCKTSVPIHESEKPSICFEETNSGRIYSNIQTSLTNYIEKESKLKSKKKEKCKTSVPIHESELPTFCFEEASSGKMYSNIQTSMTNYKENLKKEKCNKTNIVVHESEKPSMIFEEINAGNRHKYYPTSVTEYKEEKKI